VAATGLAGVLAVATQSIGDGDYQGAQDKSNSDGRGDDHDGQVQRRNPIPQNHIQLDG
jgi:hypothetical protein